MQVLQTIVGQQVALDEVLDPLQAPFQTPAVPVVDVVDLVLVLSVVQVVQVVQAIQAVQIRVGHVGQVQVALGEDVHRRWP